MTRERDDSVGVAAGFACLAIGTAAALVPLRSQLGGANAALIIVLVVFGTGKLSNIGSSLGTAIRDSSGQPLTAATQQHLIDREVFVTSTESIKRPIQISGNLDYRATFTMCSVANPGFSAFTDPLPVED